MYLNNCYYSFIKSKEIMDIQDKICVNKYITLDNDKVLINIQNDDWPAILLNKINNVVDRLSLLNKIIFGDDKAKTYAFVSAPDNPNSDGKYIYLWVAKKV